MTSPPESDFDVALIGGGIVGLWLAQTLRRANYRVVLFEADQLGAAQTLAAQGIVHSGIKYGSGSERSRLRDGLATMPDRWRACLAGAGEPYDPDLSSVQPVSDECLLFSSQRGLDRIRQFAAGKLLTSSNRALDAQAQQRAFASLGFTGKARAVAEPVLPVPTLLKALYVGLEPRCYRHQLQAEDLDLQPSHCGLTLPDRTLRVRSLLLCAGAGNELLLRAFGDRAPVMVRKPLHQVIVRHPRLPSLNGHCLSDTWGAEPAFTVTSHQEKPEGWNWYLGGALATGGCERKSSEQIGYARTLLQRIFPAFDWAAAAFSTLRIDRAEPANHPASGEPFTASLKSAHCIWPIKLALVPALGTQLLKVLPPPQPSVIDPPLALPGATIGLLPWHRS